VAAERLQKILAHAGIASRRAAEALVVSGRVRVNGRVVTELGSRADPRKDKIELDGRRIVAEHVVYYVLHKPRGVVSTMDDPEGRPSVGEIVGRLGARVYPVGRLDFHTSGALVLTNDGELANALLHPRHGVPKVYVAKLRGHLELKDLERLREGVELDDGTMTAKADVFVLRQEDTATWLRIVLREGKNRQIHRMAEAIGHQVMRLSRQSFAGIDIEDVRPGEVRELHEDEVEKLRKTYVVAGGKALPVAAETFEGDEEEPPRPREPRRAAGARPKSPAPARKRAR